MLGVDVSKEKLDCALVCAASRKVVWDKETSNTPDGIAVLLAKTPSSVPWVVEPTGRYSLRVVGEARHAGRTVLMAPPRQARRYMESHNPRAITDRTAARNLAYFGLDRDLAEYPLKVDYVDEIDQLLSARRGVSQAITALHLRQRELPRAAQLLAASVAALNQQIERLDAEIEHAAKRSPIAPVVRRLRAMPGVGPVTSAAFASRLVAKDFTRPAQWVAYCGLDVTIRQSGKHKGELGLTKQGDAELRRLAYVAAQAAVRTKGSPFAAQFARELAKGMTKTAAYCAVSRKLLAVAWAIAHHGIEYASERVYAPPWERRKMDMANATTGTTPPASAEDRATLGSDPSADRGVTTRTAGGDRHGAAVKVAPSPLAGNTGSDTEAANPTRRQPQTTAKHTRALDKGT